jgi:DNA polymerase delta subunit 2
MEVDDRVAGAYDDLLSDPLDDLQFDPPIKTERNTAVYRATNDRFILANDKNYDRQFSQLYFYRLGKMRQQVVKSSETKWPGTKIVRIVDAPEGGEDVTIIGTLYKEMKLKPSILDEYVKDRALGAHVDRTRFISSDDKLILEDDGSRISLIGSPDLLNVGSLVTGVVAGIRGHALPNGDFQVSGVCFASMAPQKTIQKSNNNSDEPSYVLLASGIAAAGGNQGETTTDHSSLRLAMLLEYLNGSLGGEMERGKFVSKIAHVVIAGGILPTSSSSSSILQPTNYSSEHLKTMAAASIQEADMHLTEIAAAVPLDIMPGPYDPANYSLPQQPLHPCLLPVAGRFSSVVRATNPHEFEVEGIVFLGTSGQNVDDVYRYSNLCGDNDSGHHHDQDDAGGRVEVLEEMLKWRHLVPTAPDTLSTYPYHNSDPFILESTPHVFFAGGQPRFGTKVIEGENGQKVRLVSVPSFADTGCVALVNLHDLSCKPLYFSSKVEV